MSIFMKIALSLLIKFLTKKLASSKIVPRIQEEIEKVEKLHERTEIATLFKREITADMLPMFEKIINGEKVSDCKLSIVKKAIEQEFGTQKYTNAIIELLLLKGNK